MFQPLQTARVQAECVLHALTVFVGFAMVWWCRGRMADPELQADIAALRKQAQADLAVSDKRS